MLRGAPARAVRWDEKRATVGPRKCASCNLELQPTQQHTCHNCERDIHGKIIADLLGNCVVTQPYLATDDSILFCNECSRSNQHLVDKSVKTAVKTSETAFAAALVPSKKPQATGSNTARLHNMASSTNAFSVLMAPRGQASITGAPVTDIASIVKVAHGTGTAPRDSSAAVATVSAVAVADVASLAPPPEFLEAAELGPDVAPPDVIPLNVKSCLLQYNTDLHKTNKELGIFYKSASKVQ